MKYPLLPATILLPALLLTPAASFGQAPTELPPKKSKLDLPEEEEAPPKKPAVSAPSDSPSPPKKSKLDEPEESPPKKSPSKAPPVEQEVAPQKRTPSLLSGSTAPSEEEESGIRVCDLVFINQRETPVKLFPIPFEFPIPSQLRQRELKFARLTSTEKGVTTQTAQGYEITGVRYYEERMWQAAAEALNVTTKRLAEPGALHELSTPEAIVRANTAEKILVTAIAEHDSAVQANQRRGTQWDKKFRLPLVQALLNIRLSRADLLLAEGKLEAAERYLDNLLKEFRDVPNAADAVRTRFEGLYLSQTQKAIAGEQYDDARRLIGDWLRRYPHDRDSAMGKTRENLIQQALQLAQQAEALPPEQVRDAKALLARAAVIWPDLPGLEASRLKLDQQYRVLQCAYTSLPENFSPILARTPVERHAVSLLFESLVRWWDGKSSDADEGEGGHHEPQLAAGRPMPLSRGRQFYLHDCRWSDSTAGDPHVLTAEDVRFTVKLLSNKDLPGHLPAWARLVRDDVQTYKDDPFSVCIWLNRDHWQPLSLMDFRILPRRSFGQGTRTELEAFNKSPVGTGPYRLADATESDSVRFVANQHYRQSGKPVIHEINFIRRDPAVAKELFLQGKVHVVYDLQPEHVAEIRQQRRTVKTVRSPSVWFLAPRYGADRPSLLDDKNLRLAIAHGIDRAKILDQYFRTGDQADHTPLTGPYPRNSWAYNTSLTYSATKASGYASEARKTLKNLRPLRLIYPDNDPITETACQEMQAQLKPLSIDLELAAVRPEELAAQVDAGNFDLAYWRHDFKDESYWLWPLLDPSAIGPGGPNFMRYFQDPGLAELFTELNSHKRFPEIQALTHKVHRHIFENAIMIPLWQLDTYVAVDDALKNVRLDPWVLYGNVEQWKLELRSK